MKSLWITDVYKKERILNISNVKSMKIKKNIQQNLTKFAQILGIVNNMYKLTLVQKFLRIKVYNALPLPTVLYESEIWTVILKDKNY